MTTAPDQFSPPPQSTGGAAAEDVTWTRFVIAVLKYPRLLIALPILLVLAVLGSAVLLPHQSTVASSFLPEQASRQSGLNALAAEFGLQADVGGADSPDFYADLLRSEQLLKDAAITTYHFPAHPGETDTIAGSILDLYQIEGATQDDRVRSAIDLLRDLISVRTNRLTSVVTLETRTRWLGLSRALNQRLLDLTNQFNVERRQSRAAVERKFVEGRLEDARQQLRAAEAELQQFWARNRGFESSQQLRFESSRLQRQVDLRQEMYATLSRSYEQSRIDEVRNTPVITVIDPPVYPLPTGGPLVRRSLMALFAGLGLAAGIALLGEFVAGMRARRPEDFAEMGRRARAMLGALLPGRRR